MTNPTVREAGGLVNYIYEEESSKGEDKNRLIFSADRYDGSLVGEQTVGSVTAWVLDVKPKQATKFTYHGRIWVSKADYGVIRVQGEPAKNPSWLVNETSFDSEYEQVGRFWLMAKNTTVSHVRLGGEARLTIRYVGYQVEEAGAAVVASADAAKNPAPR